MGWFCLLWTILFAAAGNVSCQELTTLLPQDDDACMRNEVTFSCIIRGSLTLRDLVLAWSSPEYIGQGDPLRLTTQDTPGANNMTSMINENVTATLISNTMIGGVPVLVSELHIIGADQSSVITCTSETNATSNETMFISSAFPGRPQNVEARERSAGNCDIQVTWSPPANIDRLDIGSYRVYVPSRNMVNVSSSTTIDLTVPNCGVGNISIQVAAVNLLGCVGPNSSRIPLSLLEVPTTQDANVSRAALIAIGTVATIVIVLLVIVIAIVISLSIVYSRKGKIHVSEKLQVKEIEFNLYLGKLYDALEQNEPSLMQEAVRQLLDLMLEEEIPSSSIKKLLKTVIETKFTSARGIKRAISKLNQKCPNVMKDFDAQLKEAGSAATVDSLIVSEEGHHLQLCGELIEQVDNALPETLEYFLQKLFEELQESIKECLLNLYSSLKRQDASSKQPSSGAQMPKGSEEEEQSIPMEDFENGNATPEETSIRSITRSVVALRAELKKAKPYDIRDGLKYFLEELRGKEKDDIQGALDNLKEIISGISSIDDIMSTVEELREKLEQSSSEEVLLKEALDSMMGKVLLTTTDEVKEILLRLCDSLVETLLKLSPEQAKSVRKFEVELREAERLLTAGGEGEHKGHVEFDGEEKIFYTHFNEILKGTRKREFLVVDVGVNHLRMQLINIVNGRIKKKDFVESKFGDETRKSYEGIFDLIVKHIAELIKEKKITKKLPIAFIFPFLESLTSGKLIHWTGGEGNTIVQLLKEAVTANRESDGDGNISVAALVSEDNVAAVVDVSTSILLAKRKEVLNCYIGLTLGDGATISYMEDLDTRDHKVIINTALLDQWRDDGKVDPKRTDCDGQSDHKPKQQLFEKMISDKHQGEIVYLVLKDLIDKGELFEGVSSATFDKLEALSRGRLGAMEGWDMDRCKKIFNRFDIEASDRDCEVIRRVCEAVSTRAARLAAAGIVAFVKKIGKSDGCTVAVDASLYEKHPQFPESIQVALNELVPGGYIKIQKIQDGSSRGAALAAAMSLWSPSPVGSEGQLKIPPEDTKDSDEDLSPRNVPSGFQQQVSSAKNPKGSKKEEESILLEDFEATSDQPGDHKQTFI